MLLGISLPPLATMTFAAVLLLSVTELVRIQRDRKRATASQLAKKAEQRKV